jgi:hypothetical protein
MRIRLKRRRRNIDLTIERPKLATVNLRRTVAKNVISALGELKYLKGLLKTSAKILTALKVLYIPSPTISLLLKTHSL